MKYLENLKKYFPNGLYKGKGCGYGTLEIPYANQRDEFLILIRNDVFRKPEIRGKYIDLIEKVIKNGVNSHLN